MTEKELPPGWVWSTLGEVSAINPSTDLSTLTDEAVISFVPMASVEEATGRLDPTQTRQYSEIKRKSFTKFQERDVLFAKITPCMENGKIALASGLVGGIGFGSTEFHVIRAADGMSIRYLLHYLMQKSVRVEAERNMTGAVGQRRVPTGYLRDLEIPVPPLAEQERIVDTLEGHLSRLDAAISGLQLSKRRAGNLRRSMVFQGIKGELSGSVESDQPTQVLVNKIDKVLAERKSKRHKTLANELQGTSYPDHWIVRSLGSLCTRIEYGTSAKTGEPSSSRDIPVLRMGNIQEGRIDASNLKYLPEDHPEVRKLLLEEGDLLFNRTNSAELVGKAAVYHSDLGVMTYASYLIRCSLAPGIEPEWVNLFINSFEGRRYIKSVASQQVGQANVNGTKLAGFPIPVPPHEEQLRILNAVREWDATVLHSFETANRALRQSRQLRQSLLNAAFAGNLVAQDPADESASELLNRVRTERAAQPKPKRNRASKKTDSAGTFPAPAATSDPAGTFVQEELGL